MSGLGDTLSGILENTKAQTSAFADIKKYNICSIAGIPFYWTKIEIDDAIYYGEMPTNATGASQNFDVNGITKNGKSGTSSYLYKVSSNASTIKVEGFVVGLEARTNILATFKYYNDIYLDSKGNKNADIYQANQIKGGYAALVLPLDRALDVLVVSHSRGHDFKNVGIYTFTANFAVMPDVLDFQYRDPTSSAKHNIFGAPDSMINKALAAIKSFNLSYWINSGLATYDALMDWSGLREIEDVMDTVSTIGSAFSDLTNLLKGEGEIVAIAKNLINNMVNKTKDFVNTPVEMLNNVKSLFGAVVDTDGDSASKQKVFKKIIEMKPPQTTPNNYNAMKIINNNFIYSMFNNIAFIGYANESVKKDFKYSDQIAQEKKQLLTFYNNMSPSIFNEEVENVMVSTMNHLSTIERSTYFVTEINVRNTGLPSLLYGYFGRIDQNDIDVMIALNPNLSLIDLKGTIKLPSKTTL